MRELLLVRHGQAEAAAFGGDAARALTAEGRAAIDAVGRGLAALGLVPDLIWHSPFVRAAQTAELLANALAISSSLVRQEPLLVPGASGERAARALREASARRVLCVSHLPLLPELVGRLVGTRTDFGTGTVAHLALTEPHGAALIGLWSAALLARVR
ncbi:MAG: histidine phosphatase family protein [Deltaproteobacteria bacterium]|nr:histidine phosphatase family protein [Deltaproteobacteria bacterium]